MRSNRIKVAGAAATYHCMTRTVNGERLFGDREKEVLRKMIRRVADRANISLSLKIELDIRNKVVKMKL
jgi:hypothetical protein